jgi:hypothetical protein
VNPEQLIAADVSREEGDHRRHAWKPDELPAQHR